LRDFQLREARVTAFKTQPDEWARFGPWMQADDSLCFAWHATPDTLWYYWCRYGRLVGYDVVTRQCIGSLGPNGFSQDLSGGGDRFINSENGRGQRTLWTATTLYLVDFEKRSTKALFTTTSDDPISMASENVSNGYDWEYEAVATKRFIHLLTAEGKPVWKAPYEPAGPAYTQLGIYYLQPPGQFALWMAPSRQESQRADWKLPDHVVWLGRDQGVAPLQTPAARQNGERRCASSATDEFSLSPRQALAGSDAARAAVAQLGERGSGMPPDRLVAWAALPLFLRRAGWLGGLPCFVRRARLAGVSERAGMARARSLPQLQEAAGGGSPPVRALRSGLRPARKDRDGGIRAVAGRMIGVGLLARC
jgi:hypothetical protein